MPKFSRVSRLFDAGDYDKFEQAVGLINRALTTESYRTATSSTPAYNDTNCEYLSDAEIVEKLDAGIDVVSATFVTPIRRVSRAGARPGIQP